MWQTVELTDLRAFLAVADELHFGRAAEQLRIDRSRVSQIISGLEAKIGARVFDRTSRRVRLTPVGELLLANVAPVYAQLQGALNDTCEAVIGIAGTLRIGIYSPLSDGVRMTEIVHTFETRHPGCDVAFINIGYERNYLEVLRARDADVLAFRLPLNAPDITIGPVLSREDRVVVIARSDPLAKRESISYEDLGDRAVTDVPSFPREMMDAFIPPNTPSGRVLRRIPNVHANDVLMRVALGKQVHPTVRSFLDHHSHPGVTSVPIRDLPPSDTALVWLTANHAPKIDAFARAATDVLAQTDLSGER